MKEEKLKEIANKIFNNIFECDNPYNNQELLEKFAFDLNLPQEVRNQAGNPSWTSSNNAGKYISLEEVEKVEDWMQEKPENINLEGVIAAWQKINYITTDRNYNSVNIFECDPTEESENIIKSKGVLKSKNIIFCDEVSNSEYMLASQRSANSSYCIRVDDSANCSNSYNVVCSSKISNSLFIQDCNNLHECMFCAHISNKKFCIANMQFEEEEYYEIKKEIIKWIMSQK